MKPALRRFTHASAVVGLALFGLPALAAAQDPCPSASGVESEAGWTAYQAGDMEEARARFEAALARCDNDQYARTGLGYVALREGATAEATTIMNTVVLAEPNNVDALVGLGLASWRTADLEGVRSYFERVVQLAPDHPTALEYLERIAGADQATSGPTDPADQAWLAGDTESALRLYTARLDEDPTDGLALLRVGLITAWSERYDAALELLNALIDLEPTNIDGRLARARVYAWSGDIPTAQDEVSQILAVQPDNADALAAVALFQSWSGQLDEALASYDDLLSIAPEHGAGRRQQAMAMAWASQYEQSLDAYESLVSADPNDLDARLGLATALGYSGDYEGAIAQYDEVLLRAPDDMRALTGQAKTFGWAGRLVESERVALRAVEIDDASAEAWAGLGQVYRWQGRVAAAKEALATAAGFAPTNAEIRDQVRSVDLALAPLARPTVTSESDSDGNSMVTTSLTASWHPLPRLDVRADGYHKRLQQDFTAGSLERKSSGVTVSGTYQLWPGWTVTGGLGGNVTDGSADQTYFAYRAGVRTPDRFRFGAALNVSSEGLDETAILADVGVRNTQVLLSGRWFPSAVWRVDGSLGLGSYEGSEKNGRRSAFLGASRKVGRFFSVGGSLRGFSFEQNLDEGYFDPDFYGIAEVTSYWLYRPVPWTFLVELAPGVQQVTSNGDPGTSIRSNARVAYRVGAGREVSLSFGYSSAGLTSFATGSDGYSYTAFILGFNWVF